MNRTERESMKYNITMQSLIEGFRKQALENSMQEIYLSHTPYVILKNETIDDVSVMVQDNSLPLFIVSSKRDVEFNPDDIEVIDDLEELVWKEMLENMEIIKQEIIKLGLVIVPLFGQYKYEEIDRLTFEHSILVPMARSYTGYSIDVGDSFQYQQVADFNELALDLCDVLGQETILFKSIYFEEGNERTMSEMALTDKSGKIIEWMGRKVKKVNGRKVLDYASILMEDAEREVPGLDITELYKEDLREALLDSDQWWSISNSKDGSLVNVMSSLYTKDEKKILNSLVARYM